MLPIPSPSSGKYTIAAEPPQASCAFATRLIVTVFVMDGTSGHSFLAASTACFIFFLNSISILVCSPFIQQA